MQQTTTLDLSKLLMQNDQRPTPAAVKTVVEPLAQKIEQLVRDSQKKSHSIECRKNFWQSPIALEVTAQRGRLEIYGKAATDQALIVIDQDRTGASPSKTRKSTDFWERRRLEKKSCHSG